MPTNDKPPACQGQGRRFEHPPTIISITPRGFKPPAQPAAAPLSPARILWVSTPVGVFTIAIGHPAMRFTRCEVPGWLYLGDAWDALPWVVQRDLEACGIGRRKVEVPLTLAYFAALRAA